MAPGDLRDLRDLHDILTVTIDGVPVPALDGAIVNRTYDPQTNTIAFAPASAPEPGATPAIEYVPECLP